MRDRAARLALAAAALLLPRLALAQAVTGSAGAAVLTTAAKPAVHYECIYDLQIEGKVAPVRYHLEAKVDGGDLRGEETIEIDPQGAAKLDDVVLFLFPNVLREPLAGQDSKTFYWVNPARFGRGGMALEALTLEDGTPLAWQPLALDRRDDAGNDVRLPAGTAIRAALPGPADGTVKIRARFALHVPERYGTFARYRGELFLTGGWFPQVAARDAAGRWDASAPLPRADADVTVDARAADAVVLDRVVSLGVRGAKRTARRTVHAQVWSRPSVALLVSPSLREEKGAGAIPLLERSHSSFYAGRILRVAAKARAFLSDRGAVRADDPPVPLHEAPLARELVYPDAPIGVVSDRVYRLFGPLRKYEDVQVARAEIAAEMRDGIYAREPGDDAPWVLDLVAWALARDWQRQALHLRDPREFVKPFGFIPSVDIVLHRPDFPFAAEFYDNFYYTDFLRDDVARFNHDLAAGKVVWEKLVDREGAAKAGEILDAYLSGGATGGFRAVAEKVTGEKLDGFFAQWRAPLPRVNYRLVRVKDAQEKDGTWTSEITLAREGAPVEEPVPVRLTLPGAYRWGSWNSAEGNEGTIRVSTPVRPRSWIIDPNARLYQTSLRDDRIPPTWQGLLQYAYVDYDFKLKRVDGAAGLTFERTNDLRNEIIADGFYNPHSTGADIGFSHSAGPFSYYRGLMHRFGFLVIGEHLDRSFGKNGLHVVPGFDPTVSNVHDTSSLQLFYRYDSRDDWRFPRRGTRLLAMVEGGISVVGRASNFEEVDAQAVQLVPLSDNNVFAAAAKAGTFLGNDARSVPLSKLFSLGGIDDVRGISPPEVVGPARFLVAGEWRHYALHDQDWNLWLVRVRGVQGALFVDGGYISAHPGNAPPVSDWVASAGYGLRVMYDFLGVRPQVFRIEMAQRIDNQEFARFRPDWRVYIGAGQSF